jgi:low affinity Fe/Cu permease
VDLNRHFSRLAGAVAHATGTPLAFLTCVAVVLVWGITGPLFQFSDTWQLVINTGTTIVTFLMVFLIQNTQNRDGAAIQTKLDELIRASDAGNEFMGIERLTDRELEHLHRKCARAAAANARLLQKAEAERTSRQVAKTAAAKPAPAAKASAPAKRIRRKAAA